MRAGRRAQQQGAPDAHGETLSGGDERGSGSILAVAILAGVVALTGLILPSAAVLVGKARAAHAADSAALAAADVASGLTPGAPCGAAEELAAMNGAVLVSCLVEGTTVTVGVGVDVGALSVPGRSTAGQPASTE